MLARRFARAVDQGLLGLVPDLVGPNALRPCRHLVENLGETEIAVNTATAP